MTFQEKRSLVYLFSTPVLTGFFFLYLYSKPLAVTPARIHDYDFWAKYILLFIAVSIVAQIVIYILFYIINTIGTGIEEPDITDERDKLIELKTLKISNIVFSIGFILGLASILTPLPSYSLFIIIILFGTLAEIAGRGAEFFYYRRES
ncbi:MAG: hypothetical protein JXA46_01575 [Dehalococcoidales bacterium]|nr:hypothetical protein [Dehalococcoidales bacterium]